MARLALHLLCIALCCLPLFARAGTIALVQSEDSAAYREFANALKQGLRGSGWQLASIQNSGEQRITPDIDLIVSAGSEAFRSVLAQGPGLPVLATLLPRSAYEDALQRSPQRPRNVSAIYLDQPARRQAAFLRLLLPGRNNVGLLVGSGTRSQLPGLRAALAQRQLRLDTEYVEQNEMLLPAMEALLPRVDVLLALPDSQLYRRETIKPILITAYRHQRPLVAFSAAFVKSGALAALYATPEQMGRQVASQVAQSGARLPAPSGADEFTISINDSVAEALGWRIQGETALYRALSDDGEGK